MSVDIDHDKIDTLLQLSDPLVSFLLLEVRLLQFQLQFRNWPSKAAGIGSGIEINLVYDLYWIMFHK